MRTLGVLLFAVVFCFTSCNQEPELILTGYIGDNLESVFVLEQNGDKFSGTFHYLSDESNKIKVNGTQIGETLRIEEFSIEGNKLTGIFEGTFDGKSYVGNWTDPVKKQRVPFKYTVEAKTKDEKQTVETKPKITYVTSKHEEDSDDTPWDYYLFAYVDEKEYKLGYYDEDRSGYTRIVNVLDFNNNGLPEALVESFCTGSGCFMTYLNLYIFDLATNQFVTTDGIFTNEGELVVERWKNQWSIQTVIGDRGNLQHLTNRFILNGLKLEKVEKFETKSMITIKEVRSDKIRDYGSDYSLFYDLNGDGKMDKIKIDYWGSQNNLIWQVILNDGTEVEVLGNHRCRRIGILPTKTNNVHDLVCGLDIVYQWDGKKYVEKPND